MSNLTNNIKRSRIAVFLFYCCQGLIFASWASRIPDLKAGLKLDDSAWGTMLLMLALGQGIGMSMSGFFVSKFGGKKILLTTLILCPLMLLPIALATDVYSFMQALVLFGIVSNFLNISLNAQGIATEAMYDKSIMSSFHGGWSLGGFFGVLIGLLMVKLNITSVYQFLSVSGIIILITIFNFRYLPTEQKKEKTEESETNKKLKKPEKFLYLLGLVAFFAMFIEGTMFDWSGIYFKDVVQVKPSLVLIGFAGFMVMMATGRFLSDRIADKRGRLAVIKICATFSFVGLLIAILFPYLITATFGFMLVGLGVSSIVPMVYSIAGKKTKLPSGLALTVVASIGFLGFLLGPPVIGYISSITNLRYSFVVASLFAIVIVGLTSRINVFKKEE